MKQLDGKADSNISFTVKPVASSQFDNVSGSATFTSENLLKASNFFEFKLFPIAVEQQLNSTNSYGWNDGLMIPAKGFQQYVSGGVFLKAGPLSIQALPEFVYAANPDYLEGNDRAAADSYSRYIGLNNYGADLPPYYEQPNFRTFGFGQSSIRLNFGRVSLGLSNENLWWGPGRKNSLVMSNTARGFKHATFNTTRPVKTLIGSFEAQIIGGKLENSSSPLNALKSTEWRYLSGMVINYQPKWVPGLFLGLTRVFQIYNNDIKGISDYVPLFQPFEKKNTKEEDKRRDQLTSVFARFVFKEAQAEVYAEFARNDHSFNARDFLQEPQHSRAYLLGFQKLIPAPATDENFLFSAELTQMSQPLNRVLRSAGTWYVHDINQGYTNGGEILGAGIGPGGSFQTFEFSWLSGLKKLGVQFERFEHNRDYYQEIIDPSGDYNERWIDLSGGFLANWNYKNLLIRGKLIGVQSLNYLWQTGINNSPKRSAFNVHANLGLYYSFK
ncbi:MAG: capsule assembly Wzi family protein [Bacteroidota bacterium]